MNGTGPLLLTGLTLVVAGLGRWRRLDDFCLLMGAGNVMIGAGITIDGAPLGVAWAGTVNLTLGLLLWWWWWTRRRRRDRARRWLGAKSAAARAVLVQRMREAAQPV